MSGMDSPTREAVRRAKAFSHPTRVRAIGILNQRAATPAEIAALIGQPVGRVSYHIAVLLRLGAIELVEERQSGRGGIEHVYRATMRPEVSADVWETAPEAHDAYAMQVVDQAHTDYHRAAHAGVLTRTERHITSQQLALDDEGWHELYRLLYDVMQRADEIQDRCLQRLLSTSPPADPVRACLNLQLHEAPPD